MVKIVRKTKEQKSCKKAQCQQRRGLEKSKKIAEGSVKRAPKQMAATS